MSPVPTEFDGTITDAVLFGTNAVHGYIYGDKKGRFPNNHLVHISKVLEVWFLKDSDDIVRTKNSTYRISWAHNMRPKFGTDIKINRPRKK